MDSFTLDTYLDLLSNHRRRAVLEQLRQGADDSIAFEALVDQLSERQHAAEPPPEHPESDTPESYDTVGIATQLHHTHLPKLDTYGVVEYDPDSGTVEYDPPTEFERVLERLHGRQLPSTA